MRFLLAFGLAFCWLMIATWGSAYIWYSNGLSVREWYGFPYLLSSAALTVGGFVLIAWFFEGRR